LPPSGRNAQVEQARPRRSELPGQGVLLLPVRVLVLRRLLRLVVVVVAIVVLLAAVVVVLVRLPVLIVVLLVIVLLLLLRLRGRGVASVLLLILLVVCRYTGSRPGTKSSTGSSAFSSIEVQFMMFRLRLRARDGHST
jgi:hypothetical protein